MTFDPAEPLTFRGEISNKLQKSLGDNVDLTDLKGGGEKYDNLLYWAVYLGFGDFYGKNDKENTRLFMINPTTVVRTKLNNIFSDKDRLTIMDFLASSGKIIPVLDTGETRAQIERSMTESYRCKENHISKSFSFAIKQLEFEQLITLEMISDAESMTLDFGGAAQKQRVSGIKLIR